MVIFMGIIKILRMIVCITILKIILMHICPGFPLSILSLLFALAQDTSQSGPRIFTLACISKIVYSTLNYIRVQDVAVHK